MELDRRGCVVQPRPWANRQREEPVDEAKPFNAMSWQRPNIGSRINREVHVRFWERAEVKFLRANSAQTELMQCSKRMCRVSPS